MGLNSHPPTMPQLHVASLRPKPQVLPDSTTCKHRADVLKPHACSKNIVLTEQFNLISVHVSDQEL